MTTILFHSLFAINIIFGFDALPKCDCNSITDEDKSTLVFTGRVSDIKKKKAFGYQITLVVEEKIKGSIKGKRAKIFTPCFSEYCCGIPFSLGDEYYVVTKVMRGKYYTTICTTTSKIIK